MFEGGGGERSRGMCGLDHERAPNAPLLPAAGCCAMSSARPARPALPVTVPDVDRATAAAAAVAPGLRERPSRGPIAAVRSGREVAVVAGPVRRTQVGCAQPTAIAPLPDVGGRGHGSVGQAARVPRWVVPDP